MEKNYTRYTADQLLNDDFFIRSEQHPTKGSQTFWSSLEEQDEPLAQEIRSARLFLRKFSEVIPHTPLRPAEISALWAGIQEQNRKKKIKTIRRYGIIAAAAAAVAALLLIIPFPTDDKDVDYQSIMAELPASDKNEDVLLIFSDEEQVSIREKESRIDYNANGDVRVNSTTVRQPPAHKEKKVPHLNKLIAPAGKRSFLTLADGTKIWVNSSTTVIYPGLFSEDKREIYVDGEVYLEVAPNPEKPFYVKTDQMNIRVLGTRFNVCAYREDASQQIVLVSGKVEVRAEKRPNKVLKPNDLFEYDRQKEETSVTEVNPENYTSWKNGYYQFAGQQLSVLFKRLSRYYATSIVCDEKTGALRCSGKLDLTERLEEVLDNLKEVAPIRIKHDPDRITIEYEP